jgi:hypothetical protein
MLGTIAAFIYLDKLSGEGIYQSKTTFFSLCFSYRCQGSHLCSPATSWAQQRLVRQPAKTEKHGVNFRIRKSTLTYDYVVLDKRNPDRRRWTNFAESNVTITFTVKKGY